ncbi:MAG: glycosyltransferase family protein [Deltaproteobacteria bacterium]|nr:glycosyltransferase family protein [Deltaproteobacteria bacterium]
MTGQIVGIVQMRMNSSRLPGKMLKPLGKTDVAGLVLGRVGQARRLSRLVAATTDSILDDPLAKRCQDLGLPVFRGQEDDVLDRFYQCAREHQAGAVVRLTGDCPFHDPAVIDQVVQAYLDGAGRLAYVSNVIPPTYPDGLDVEVVSLAALEQAWQEAELTSDREHVTPFIWKDPHRFPQGLVRHEPNLSALRWTLDEPQDFEFLLKVLELMDRPPLEFTMFDVLAVLEAHPELMEINQALTRNESYWNMISQEAVG